MWSHNKRLPPTVMVLHEGFMATSILTCSNFEWVTQIGFFVSREIRSEKNVRCGFLWSGMAAQKGAYEGSKKKKKKVTIIFF